MHPDPSVCRVGRDFYLACSSFEYFPGVPLFASRDLVTWRPIGHALTRRSQLDLSGVPSSGGIYAPTLRHHDGTFFVVTTLVGRGNFVVTARDPRGPWSDPIWLDEDGIDPSLAFLDERIYYTRNGRGADRDHPFVYQGELTREADGFRMTRTPRVIWKGTGGVWPEAPHLYRRDGWHYLVTAEGGTSYGHSVVVARSRRPYGPFEPSPHGPLITHRGRPRHPIQATGHADLVDLEDGTTWAVLLGIRPTGGRHHHLGRETYLAPVHWRQDGWPRMPPLELTMQGPALPALRPSGPRRPPGLPGTPPPPRVELRSQPGAWGLLASRRARAPAPVGRCGDPGRRLLAQPRLPAPAAPRDDGSGADPVRNPPRGRAGRDLHPGQREVPRRARRRGGTAGPGAPARVHARRRDDDRRPACAGCGPGHRRGRGHGAGVLLRRRDGPRPRGRSRPDARLLGRVDPRAAAAVTTSRARRSASMRRARGGRRRRRRSSSGSSTWQRRRPRA